MKKMLIIAEKPSVARDIAKALSDTGRFVENEGYHENKEYVVTSALGHLLTITVDERYDPKKGRWTLDKLPCIPPHFSTVPIQGAPKKYLDLCLRLMKRDDVSTIVNACDAGREGELIFELIHNHALSKGLKNKPVKRLWLQSMQQSAIREQMTKLFDAKEKEGLRDSALCRSEADWLVGINLTRAVTAFVSGSGFKLTTVGRVQTPTLQIVVNREKSIQDFVSEPYVELEAEFCNGASTHDYKGTLMVNGVKKHTEKDSERYMTEIYPSDVSKVSSVSDTVARQVVKPPMLFDLTSLQRECNSLYGYSAKTTLSIAQALYETHKVLTYPRTDSKYLPEGYYQEVVKLIREVESNPNKSPSNKRIFDNKQVRDHFAIVPTGAVSHNLDDRERKVYTLVTNRLLSAFSKDAVYDNTTRETKVNGYTFVSTGRITIERGWTIYGNVSKDKELPSILPLSSYSTRRDTVEITHGHTKPPARLTEATLLSAMENAHRHINDDEYKEGEVKSGVGLGTPATRAAIIEGLIEDRYIMRGDSRSLLPMSKGMDTIATLESLGIQSVLSPKLTADWERRLEDVELGLIKREVFMSEVGAYIQMTMEHIKGLSTTQSEILPGTILESPCPRCGNKVGMSALGWRCETACGFKMPKVKCGLEIDKERAETLLTKKTLGHITGNILESKSGKKFDAEIALDQKSHLVLNFPKVPLADGQGAITEGVSIGHCPRCKKGKILLTDTLYVCSEHQSRKCDGRVPKTLAGYDITHEEALGLFKNKDTEEHTFTSKAGKPFKASLSMAKNKGATFKFSSTNKRKWKKK